MAIISLFYYLRIIKMMYFDEAEGRPAVSDTADMKAILSINSLALLGLGILPGGLMALCVAAVA
jgi:NADH-quinone oxidoreductase subunit N